MQNKRLALTIAIIILLALIVMPRAIAQAYSSVNFFSSSQTTSAVVAVATSSCGSGFYSENFSSAWLAKIRHGGAGGFRAKLNSDELFTGGIVPWPNGGQMHIILVYSISSGNATLTVSNTLPAYDPVVMSAHVPGANGKLLITGKTSFEAAGMVMVGNVTLNGSPVAPCDSFTAQGNDGVRDIKYLLIDGVSQDFTLDCDVTFSWGSNPKDEGPALQIDVENLSQPIPTPTPIPTPAQPSWDLNGDHVCDIGDVVRIGLVWRQTGSPSWIPEDLNSDGIIDIGDVVVVGLHWGETW